MQPTKSEGGRREATERRYRAWTAGVTRWSGGPFEKQLEHFRAVFGDLGEDEGPPIVWRPHPEQIAGSNLGRLMGELGFDSYADCHRWSVERAEDFWQTAIDRLGVVFRTAPTAISDGAADPRRCRWLPGARLNCTDSCFKAGRDRPAIVSASETSPEPTLTTYEQLEDQVNRVAAGLKRAGLGRADAVALYMPMTVDCVASYLGVVRAGCRVVSIPDSLPAPEVARRLEIGRAELVVTVDRFERSGKSFALYRTVRQAGAARAVVIGHSGTVEGLQAGDLSWHEFLGPGARFPSEDCAPDDVTNVLFSSGTTGTPKAIPWTHLTPIKCATDGHFHQDIRPGDVVAWPTNIGWMMGPWLIYAALMNDATIALYEGAPTGPGFCRFVHDARVTVLGLVPSLVRAWRESGAAESVDWTRVRVFSSTGEPSNREDYLWLMSRARYRAPVIEYCGGTEIGGGYLTGTVVQPASPATFTAPALGLDLVVLDQDGGSVGEGQAGEVFLMPPSIGLSRTLLNAEHDAVYHEGVPIGPGGRLLRRHGDRVVRLPGGYYRAAGRCDDTMNLGGIKIGSLEIERVIDAHEDVIESAAVAVQPEGGGAERLVVYAVVRSGHDHARLHQELAARIASGLNPLFKIHDLVLTDRLPRTPSNKLMRRELRDRYRPGSQSSA